MAYPFFKEVNIMDMKIAEIISRLDEMKPNTYTIPEKIRWLSELDFDLYNNILKNYIMPRGWYDRFIAEGEHLPQFPFRGYDESDVTTSGETMQTKVVVDEKAFVDMYLFFLMAKIDLFNRETTSYNNNMVLFNEEYERWKAFMNKTYCRKKFYLRTK